MTKNFIKLLAIILSASFIFYGCHRPHQEDDPGKLLLQLRKAGDLHKNGDTQKALDYLSLQIENNPSQTALFAARGEILLEAGHTLSARDDFYRVFRSSDRQRTDIIKTLVNIELENANFSQVLKILRKALKSNPDNRNLWFYRAQTEARLQKFRQAKSSILKAIELNGDNLEYHQYLINLLNLLKKENEIETRLLKLHEQFPDNAWINLRLSNRLINQGKKEEAKSILIRALRSNPHDHLLLFQMATILSLENKWEEAIVHMEKGLAEKSSAVWLKVQLAKLCLKTGKIEKAVGYMRQAVKEKTDDIFPYLTLASLHNRQNDTFEAEKLLRLGLAIDDNHQGLILEYADLLEKQADFKEAVKAYKRALINDPNNAFILGKLGRLHLIMDNYQQAAEYFSRPKELKSEDSWIRYYYIEALIKIGEWKTAKHEIEKLLESTPEEYWGHAKKAIVEHELKNYAAALQSISKAVSLKPDQSWLMEIKGEILEIMGKPKEALNAYLEIIKSSPRNPNAMVKAAYLQYAYSKKKALKNIQNALAYRDFNLSMIEFYLFLTDQTETTWKFKKTSPEYKIYENIIARNYEKAELLLNKLKTGSSSHFPFLKYLLDYRSKKRNIKMKQEVTNLQSIQSYWKLFYLGVDFLNRGDAAKAVEFLEKALRKSPGSLWITSKLAIAYQDMKLYEKTVNLLERFLVAHPKYNYIWMRTRLALNYDLSKQDKKAEKIYKEILSTNPDDHIALNNLAWMYLTSDIPEIHKPEEALPLAEKAVNINPTPSNLDTMAEALYQNQEYRQALKIIEKALSIDRQGLDDLKKTKKKILRALKKNSQ